MNQCYRASKRFLPAFAALVLSACGGEQGDYYFTQAEVSERFTLDLMTQQTWIGLDCSYLADEDTVDGCTAQVRNLPNGMTRDGNHLNWVPTSDDIGSHTLEVIFSDACVDLGLPEHEWVVINVHAYNGYNTSDIHDFEKQAQSCE